MTNLRVVEVVSDAPPLAEFDYGLITDPIQRDWAESAAGFITFGLGQAVVKVLEAGNLLIEAKQRLAHGEYLPWVEQACGLKRQQAQKLVKAAEWANDVHARHLDGITDATTLFLLSADATPEEVRQWALERCAAGDPPSRKEVQERKRNNSEAGRQRSTIDDALKVLRFSDEARRLAASVQYVNDRQLMDELGVDKVPTDKRHVTSAATFVKDKEGWIKFPMQQPVDVPATTTRAQADLFGESTPIEEVVTQAEAAARLGKKLPTLRTAFDRQKRGKGSAPSGNGWVAFPHPERGMCIIKRAEA